MKPTEFNAAERLFEHADVLRGVPNDEDINALVERNEARRRAAIAALGQNWLGWNPNTGERLQ